MVDPDNNHENDTPPSSDGGFISSWPWVMDYVDVNGLSNRIGLPKDRFIEFIVKETVDNALDFMEQEAPRLIKKYGSFAPELKVIVTKENNYLRIRILNSDCETSGFTEQFIRSIFNFHESTGSKRNQYKVTKGWLGDALKAICGIPYALTHEVGNDIWNEPLIITSGNKQFRVKPVIDRAKKKLDADVEIVELSDQTTGFTEFEIRYPLVVQEEEIIIKLSNLFLRFALINLHIAFTLELPGNAILDIPAVQTISKKWSNQISIWCYYEKDFEDLIINLQNEERMAYSILKEFREGTNISKSEASVTIGELRAKPKTFSLYTTLCNLYLFLNFNTNALSATKLHASLYLFIVSSNTSSSLGAVHSRLAIINFDDGYKSQFTNAKPILDMYGFKASFFIVCNFVGKSAKQMNSSSIVNFAGKGVEQMTWNDITTLFKQGYQIGDHTMNHLRNMTNMSNSELDYEIGRSKQCILDHGIPVTTFAYPFDNGKDNATIVNKVS